MSNALAMRSSLYIFTILTACLVCFLFYTNFARNNDFEVHVIDGGAFKKAVLIPDSEATKIYLYLVFPFGEANNSFDEGLAHYVEHLAWISTISDASSRNIRHSNAWTNQFSTGYWLTATEHDLSHVLVNLSKLSKPISIDQGFALQERNIIQREYDYRVAEWPLYNAHREIARALYGNGTLARSVIGTPHQIAQYDLESAMKLHQQTHVLSSATLLIYGIRPRNVCKMR